MTICLTISQIYELIQSGEGIHLEFKESLDKTFIEEVCAFANSSGGKILIGVKDDGTIKEFPLIIALAQSCRIVLELYNQI